MKIKLAPFKPQNDFYVSVEYERQANSLILIYMLHGTLNHIELPEFRAGGRKDNLWQNTCFELFLSQEKSDDYLEFNFSPSGDWNIYHFDALRQGMKEYQDVNVKLLPPSKSSGVYSQRIVIDLTKSKFAERPLNMGITTVTKQNSNIDYWALVHPHHDRPDFHHPAGHILCC